MKTRESIKMMVITAALTGIISIITTGINAQPNAKELNLKEAAVYTRIGEQQNKLATAVKYEAPKVEEFDYNIQMNNRNEADEIMARLNASSARLKSEVRYTAPEIHEMNAEENAEYIAGLETLNKMAQSLSESVKYVAPTIEETSNQITVPDEVSVATAAIPVK